MRRVRDQLETVSPERESNDLPRVVGDGTELWRALQMIRDLTDR